MYKLLSVFNKQLEKHQVIVYLGLKVDASLTETLRKPKGKRHSEIAQNRQEAEISEKGQDKQKDSLTKIQSKGVNTEGRWLKKNGRLIFGFKHHEVVDENRLILAVHTITAHEYDSKGLKPLLGKIPKHTKSRISMRIKDIKYLQMMNNIKNTT